MVNQPLLTGKSGKVINKFLQPGENLKYSNNDQAAWPCWDAAADKPFVKYACCYKHRSVRTLGLQDGSFVKSHMRQTILNVLRSFLALILAAFMCHRVVAPKLLPIVFFQTLNGRSQLLFRSEFLSRILLTLPFNPTGLLYKF